MIIRKFLIIFLTITVGYTFIGSCSSLDNKVESANSANSEEVVSNKVVSTNTEQAISPATQGVLGTLFDFSKFKRLYNKKYASFIEELARKKLFLARAFRAFITKIKYKHGQLKYFFNINDKSDWTAAEVKSLAKREPLKMIKDSLIEGTNNDNNNNLARSIENRDVENGESYWNGILTNAKNYIDKLKSFVFNQSFLRETQTTRQDAELPVEERKDFDIDFVDHRGNCSSVIRNQGLCGSCYIFATLAAYEWQYCRETDKKLTFAPQYVLDCGRKKVGVEGCKAGCEIRVGQFVERVGLIPENNYPYRGKEDKCPYTSEEPESNMGAIRVSRHAMEIVYYDQIEKWLKQTVILMPVKFSQAMHEYGGGVYVLEEKGTEKIEFYTFGHAMLLVGMGREKDGTDYWILRNSWGPKWGESGYLRLTKQRDNWIDDDVGFAIDVKEGEKIFLGQNEHYNSEPISRRYQEYNSFLGIRLVR